MNATQSTLLSAAALLLCSCGRDAAPQQSPIVEFSTDQDIGLVNHTDFQATAPDADGRFALYLREPSFFMVLSAEEDAKMIYLYLPEDGDKIELRIDGDILYANGIARSIFVDPKKPRNFAQWFESADESALKALRNIGTEGAEAIGTNALERILEVNPHVLIHMESGDPEFMAHTPQLAVVGNGALDADMDDSETRVFFAEGISPDLADTLKNKSFPKLRRVIHSADEGVDQLPNLFPHIKALTLMDADKTPNLGAFQDLTELHIAKKDSIPLDLNQLPHPENLRALTANVTTNVVGMEKLANLEYLNPGEAKFTDAELSALLANHPLLIFLDLSLATVESLEPLRQATRLEAVALGKFSTEDAPDFSPLANLPNLRYVALNDDLSKAGAAEPLRKACPNVVVYRHDGFCMGSGWLLLFPPIVLAALWIKRRAA